MSSKLIDLPKTIEECHELIIELVMKQAQLESDLLKTHHNLDVLKERMRDFVRQRYGRSSEKLTAGQLSLFAQGVLEEMRKEQADNRDDQASEAAKPAEGSKKHGGGRKPLPDTLPKERREYRLGDDERNCPCGCPMKEIGIEITQQLEYEPAKLRIIEHVQYKYACVKNLEGVKVAPKPAQPLAGGLAGPGLLAHITEDKHANHLPLYRQEQMFKRLGYEVPRSSMARWLAEVAELFKEILDRMKELLLESQVIHADETPLKFIDREKPRGKTRQGYLWTYYGDSKHPYVIFDFNSSRAAKAPIAFLGDYAGYLITDGYVAYEILVEQGKVTLVCCHAHARRGFEKALKNNQKDASHALGLYSQLYDIERRAANCTDEERYKMRQLEAVPLLTQFETWLKEKQLTALPDTGFGKAVNYCLNRWAALTRYTTAGFLNIDNNPVENAIRPIAIGRKNWLFCGSEEGGDTAATLASIVNTCKRLGVNPYDYIRDVLVRLAQKPACIDDLLPDRWQPMQLPTQ